MKNLLLIVPFLFFQIENSVAQSDMKTLWEEAKKRTKEEETNKWSGEDGCIENDSDAIYFTKAETNLYQGESRMSAIIAVIPKGARCVVKSSLGAEYNGGFWYICYEGKMGHVQAYTTVKKTTPKKKSTPKKRR